MSKFTDRLWREIVREHGADLREQERPSAGHGRAGRMSRLVAGSGLVGVAGLGAVLAIVLGSAGATPAYAVTHNRDGTYSVAVAKLEAIPFANARLRALGLRARLVAMDASCTSTTISGAPQSVIAPQIATAAAMAAKARINPRQIPAGRMLVVPAFRQGAMVHLAQAMSVAGTVPGCLPTPAKVCFAGVGGGPAGPGTSTTGTATSATTTGTSTTGTGTTTTGTGTSTGTTTTGTSTAATPGLTGASGAKQVAIGALHCHALPVPLLCRVPMSAGAGTSTTGTGTTTTGTSTSASQTPLPRQALAPGCMPPPPAVACTSAAIKGMTPAQALKMMHAQKAMMNARIAAIRARIAAVQKGMPQTDTTGTSTSSTSTSTSTSSSSSSMSSTSTGTTTTGTSTGPVPAPQVPPGATITCQAFGAAAPAVMPAAMAKANYRSASAAQSSATQSKRQGTLQGTQDIKRLSTKHATRHGARRGGTHSRVH